MRQGIAIPLAYGTAVHRGVELLLRGETLEEAISKGVAAYESDSNAATTGRTKASWAIALALCEFDTFAKPILLDQYEVLAVEQERQHQLTDNTILETKVDALLRDRTIGDTLTFSLKTAGLYSDWYHYRDNMALQNITEPLAWNASGVQMCYILRPKDLQNDDVATHGLLYPWTHPTHGIAWNAEYELEGRTKRLGKEWTRLPAWKLAGSPIDWFRTLQRLSEGSLPAWNLKSPFRNVIIPPASRYILQAEDITELRDNERLYRQGGPLRDRSECSTPMGRCAYYTLCIRNIKDEESVKEHGFVPRKHHHSGDNDD